MEFVIKVDLSDDQYKEYLTKTTDEIIKTEEFKKAFAEIIKNEFAEEIKKEMPRLANKTLYGGNYYSQNQEYMMTTNLVKAALDEYAAKIKEACEEYAKGCLEKTDMERIFKTILTDAVIRGFNSGIEEYCHANREVLAVHDSQISELRARLGMNNGY